MKKILLITLFLLCLSVNQLFSQSALLRGTVSDLESGKALNGANITLSPANENLQALGTVSNSNGNYEIRNIPPGRYSITVSYIGYEKFVLEPFVLTSNEQRKLDVSLKPQALEMDPVTVSAHKETIDRQSTKILEPTASVTILDTIQIQQRRAMSPADHLIGLAGVDVVKTGINQSMVAIRGFNDIFSGSHLLMVDNRIGRVASLRFNAYNFLAVANSDIERIEVIRGPAASLYGPNSASGVTHIITKSPFGSEGTTINFGLGQRSIFTTDFRFAASINNKFGFKVTGSYMQGVDFPSHDAFEDSVRTRLIEIELDYQRRGLLNPDPLDENDKRIGIRDFYLSKMAGTARFDYRINNNLTLIFNTGYNSASNMELTKISAAVVDNWRTIYGQAKLIYKNLFMQAYINTSNSGETYLTRDGGDLVDRSKFISTQIQNRTSLGNFQHFTYGIDAYWTRPVTAGTVNGVFEQDDQINEAGFYLQSETNLGEQFKFVLAGRYDFHNRIDEPFFSPRAGLVYSASQDHRFRISYSKAFTTPSTENLFLDRLVSPLIPDRFISLSPFAEFQPFNIRVRGVPDNGFKYEQNEEGGIAGLYMQPIPLYFPNQSGFIPADATVMWDKVVELITRIKGSGLDLFFAGLKSIPAPTAQDVSSVLKTFNTTTGEFELIDPGIITNILGLESTKTTTFEIGYKGILKNKLIVNVDLYYNQIKDFIGPLLLETPNVFFDEESLNEFLLATEVFTSSTQPFITLAPTFARWISNIPVGTVTPNESIYPGDLMLTFRNFGDINLVGLDLDFSYAATKTLNISGAYSYVSKNIFQDENSVRDIALNAPKQKFSLGLQYREPKSGLGWGLRYRYVAGFPVNSGVFIGEVNPFGVLDLNAGLDLPGQSAIRLTLTVQNLLDNKHKEFVGAPEIGRLAHFQVKFYPDKYKD